MIFLRICENCIFYIGKTCVILNNKQVCGAHGYAWIQALISLGSWKYDSLKLYCSLNYIQ